MGDYYVYIITNRPRGVLYTGVTNNLERRTFEHRESLFEGFTKKYKLRRLVYYEHVATAYEAIRREKAIKKWYRAWKIELIEKHNPDWIDLHRDGETLPLPISE